MTVGLTVDNNDDNIFNRTISEEKTQQALKRREQIERSQKQRRVSDSYLLKELHVRRSEQFSSMIKQIIEQNKTRKRRLSSYGETCLSESLHSIPVKIDNQDKLVKGKAYLTSYITGQKQKINQLLFRATIKAHVNGVQTPWTEICKRDGG